MIWPICSVPCLDPYKDGDGNEQLATGAEQELGFVKIGGELSGGHSICALAGGCFGPDDAGAAIDLEFTLSLSRHSS